MIPKAGGPPPDPGLGVFETLLVMGGRPLELDAHLARLDASLRALFGAPAPPDARELVLDHAGGVDPARLRLTVAPGAEGPLTCGGIGAHKWADRRLLEQAEAGLDGRVALIVEPDGTVLEASRGNLFLVRDGVLVTPPADGRILPGVTRSRVLGIAEALEIPIRVEVVSFDRLRTADEMFITGAVRGIEPVRSCDGAACGSDSLTSSRLASELQRTWAHEARATPRSPRASSDPPHAGQSPPRGAVHARIR
jgi:para-aminobenzoate synthetase/4-amino-4-deoxychorismate lyase